MNAFSITDIYTLFYLYLSIHILDDKKSEYKEMKLKDIPEAAKRALKEAANRQEQNKKKEKLPNEIGGRDGPEPVRYGDWEKNGIAVDF